MRKQRIFILFFLLFGISLIILILTKNNSKFTSPDKQVIIRVHVNDEKLILLEIFDEKLEKKEIKNTRSSIYQSYKINFLDNNNFIFDSSDSGPALFERGREQWHGMRVFSFLNPTKEFIAILVPEQELMKQTDGVNRNGDDFKDEISYLSCEYKLLVFGNGKSMHFPVGRWYHFSSVNPPHKAVKWLNENKFILQEKNNCIAYTIKDGKIFETTEVKN